VSFKDLPMKFMKSNKSFRIYSKKVTTTSVTIAKVAKQQHQEQQKVSISPTFSEQLFRTKVF